MWVGEREHTCLFLGDRYRVTHKLNFVCILGEEGWHRYSLPPCSIHSSFSKKKFGTEPLWTFRKCTWHLPVYLPPPQPHTQEKGNRQDGRGEDTKRRFYSFFSEIPPRSPPKKKEEGNREMAIWATRGGEEAPKFGSSTHHGFPNQREEEEAVYRFFCSSSSRTGKEIIGCAFFSSPLYFACLGSFSTTPRRRRFGFPQEIISPFSPFLCFLRPIISFLFTCMRKRTACDVSRYIVQYTQKLGHHGMDEGEGEKAQVG